MPSITRIASREHPDYVNRTALLSVGRDGLLYLAAITPAGGAGLLLRTTIGGADKSWLPGLWAPWNATANAIGDIAATNAHLANRVTFYDHNLVPLGANDDFKDSTFYSSPSHVAAGASGDFYACDLEGARIVRLRRDGTDVRAYAIPLTPNANPQLPDVRFRFMCVHEEPVGEDGTDVYFFVRGDDGLLRCIRFSGEEQVGTEIGRLPTTGTAGDRGIQPGTLIDVDELGTLYVLEPRSNTVRTIALSGWGATTTIASTFTLVQGPDHAAFGAPIVQSMCLRKGPEHGPELLIKRQHETEMYLAYSLAPATLGEFQRELHTTHDSVTAEYDDAVWTAGGTATLDVDAATAAGIAPRMRVWARRHEAPGYRELERDASGDIVVPADMVGLQRIKVSPEVLPDETGRTTPLLVDFWVSVVPAGATGSLSVATYYTLPALGASPAATRRNRVHYGRGEAITCEVHARGVAAATDAVVKLLDVSGDSPVVVAEGTVSVADAAVARVTLPAAFTATCRPGDYLLVAELAGKASVPQPIVLGAGIEDDAVRFVQYGDYGATYPLQLGVDPTGVANVPDRVDAHVGRAAKLGVDMRVDRLGASPFLGAANWEGPSAARFAELRDQVAADVRLPAPEKVDLPSPMLQAQGAYGAHGIRQMAILLQNDANFPLRDSADDPVGEMGIHEQRLTAEIKADLQAVTRELLPFPSFRGWSWASNWWIPPDGNRFYNTFSPEYQAARTAALATGTWSPILDAEPDERRAMIRATFADFEQTLAAMPGTERLVRAVAGSFRNGFAYPPSTFADVDEIDLQAQFEQIAIPYHAAFGADFYRRPGGTQFGVPGAEKPQFGHPEVWNDPGTGEQVVPTLFQLLMRGVDAIGVSGDRLPYWNELPSDPRTGYDGTASVLRQLGRLMRRYGAWLGTLERSDRVAIVLSGRPFKIEDWNAVMPRHFARVMEAYVSCLYAGYAPELVFVEDVPTTGPIAENPFVGYQAVLIVDQRVPFEGADTPNEFKLHRSLGRAGDSLKVFHDETSRPELMTKNARSLGIAFNHLENDPMQQGDDDAYARFTEICRANVPAIRRALDRVATPPAIADRDDVLVSELKRGGGRYVFVVNDAPVEQPTGALWRVSMHAATTRPVVTDVTLDVPAAGGVYDVLAMRELSPRDRTVTADLRDVPARVFAILPARIAAVEVSAPATLEAGRPFGCAVRVIDAAGAPIAASVPVRIALRDAEGNVIEERFEVADTNGVATLARDIMVPRNLSGDGCTIEVTELFGGREARLAVALEADVGAFTLQADPAPPVAPPTAVTGPLATITSSLPTTLDPVDAGFGPHVRDLALLADGRTAVLGALDWDENLHAIDLETGARRWSRAVGEYYAFQPRPCGDGVAVHGFDFATAEGYHLYVGDADGAFERRFALYGVPRRLAFRFVPAMLRDQNHGFAASPDGSWVATAGDLGVAAWSREGVLLWQRDDWRTNRGYAWMEEISSHADAMRYTPQLAPADDEALLVAEGSRVARLDARTGVTVGAWTLPGGEVEELQAGADGASWLVRSTYHGGQVFVAGPDGEVHAIPGAVRTAALSPDAEHVAITHGNLLRVCTRAGALRWTLPGDDTLGAPSFAADGRVATCSTLGTLYVVDADGDLLVQRDLGATASIAFLPDGDLLVATWSGTVMRLDAAGEERWSTRIRPRAAQPPAIVERLVVPTARVEGWANATTPTVREALAAPNIMREIPVMMNVEVYPGKAGSPILETQRSIAALTDGRIDRSDEPLLSWYDVSTTSESQVRTYITIDTFRVLARVTGITLVEDAAHPESWIRDAYLERFDVGTRRWEFVQPLLADAPVHRHDFAEPVYARRFRIALPWGLAGNVRLREIVLHATQAGPSHPDVASGAAVAVLYDEGQEDVVKDLVFASETNDDYYSGGHALELKQPQGTVNGVPIYKGDTRYRPVYGHAMPDWDFEIVENPEPGQYRWLQFAWKATSPATTRMDVRVGLEQSVVARVGPPPGNDELFDKKIVYPYGTDPATNVPPMEWDVVRLDLYDVFSEAPAPQWTTARLRALFLYSVGGGMRVDQILLARTEQDLIDYGQP